MHARHGLKTDAAPPAADAPSTNHIHQLSRRGQSQWMLMNFLLHDLRFFQLHSVLFSRTSTVPPMSNWVAFRYIEHRATDLARSPSPTPPSTPPPATPERQSSPALLVCRNWGATGTCAHGNNCYYAHSHGQNGSPEANWVESDSEHSIGGSDEESWQDWQEWEENGAQWQGWQDNNGQWQEWQANVQMQHQSEHPQYYQNFNQNLVHQPSGWSQVQQQQIQQQLQQQQQQQIQQQQAFYQQQQQFFQSNAPVHAAPSFHGSPVMIQQRAC